MWKDIVIFLSKKEDKLYENIDPVSPCFVSDHRVPGAFHLKQIGGETVNNIKDKLFLVPGENDGLGK